MTEKESNLIEIAKEVIDLNHQLGAALTGSLMLCVRGIVKQREASDIDIICSYLCESDEGFPIVPNGFKQIDMDGRKSQVDAISFENSEGVKIDFLYSDEKVDDVDGLPCAKIINMIAAKLQYSEHDLSDVSRLKHKQDVEFFKIKS